MFNESTYVVNSNLIISHKSVTYVDFIAPKTVDEKIVKALRSKMNIANTIMDEDWREWI